MVMERKGACQEFLSRISNLYSNNLSVVVVNNIHGAAVENVWLTLRQCDLPSMELFCFGIDSLMPRLEPQLHGILIASIPVQGPRVCHHYLILGRDTNLLSMLTTTSQPSPPWKSLELLTIPWNCLRRHQVVSCTANHKTISVNSSHKAGGRPLFNKLTCHVTI